MPNTRASNKEKHPGKCVIDAESDAENNENKEKQKRKRRTKEEMVAFREGQAIIAQQKATEKEAREKERQELLKKIAELEIKMREDDKKNVRRGAEAKSSESESQSIPKKKVKAGTKNQAIDSAPPKPRPAPKPKRKKVPEESDEDDADLYELKTPAPPRNYGKKKAYVEVDDDSESEALEPKTPMPRRTPGNVRYNNVGANEHLAFTPGPQRVKFEEVPSSVPGEEVMRPPEVMCSTPHVTHAILGKEREVVPDSQMDEPDSRSHDLQGKKKKKSAREQIEEMKDTIQQAWVEAGQRVDGNSHAVAKSVAVKESHDRFNKWLTDYIHTPQDNTGIDKRSAGGSSKRSVPSSRGGNSKVTSTAVDSLISHTDVAQSDIIIEIDDDSDVPAFEEDQKIERDAARNSPLKHGKRLSSKTMVKVVHPKDNNNAKTQKRTIIKEEPLDDATLALAAHKPTSRVTVKAEPASDLEDRSNPASEDEGAKKKSRERPTNYTSLPPALMAKKRIWRSAVLPTLINYVGTFHNPWTIDEDRIVAHLQPILDHFLPRADRYVIQAADPILRLVSQRLNEWRSSFGSTAISILDAYFVSEDSQYTPEARQTFSSHLLANKAFLYSEPEKVLANGQVRSAGIFRGDLILETFSTHLKSVTGAELDITGLKPPGRAVGALALAAAAAERALSMWKNGQLIVAADGIHSELVKLFNPSSGKMSAKHLEFSSNKWGDRTTKYLDAVLQLSDERLRRIVAESHAMTVPKNSAEGSSAMADPQARSDDEFDFELDD